MSSADPRSVNDGFSSSAIFCPTADLVGGHVEERHAAVGERVRHAADDGVAKLALEIGDLIQIARAADFRVEHPRIADALGIDPKAAQPDRAEIFVADGDRDSACPSAGSSAAAWRRSRRPI